MTPRGGLAGALTEWALTGRPGGHWQGPGWLLASGTVTGTLLFCMQVAGNVASGLSMLAFSACSLPVSLSEPGSWLLRLPRRPSDPIGGATEGHNDQTRLRVTRGTVAPDPGSGRHFLRNWHWQPEPECTRLGRCSGDLRRRLPVPAGPTSH